MAGVFQGMAENGHLDPVGMRSLGAGQPVDQALCSIGLEITPDLIELLAGVAHHLAGLGHVGKFRGKFEQRQLAPCYLLVRGHVGLLWFGLKSGNSIVNRFRSGMAAPASARPTLAVARLAGRPNCQVITVSVHHCHRRDPQSGLAGLLKESSQIAAALMPFFGLALVILQIVKLGRNGK
jgi:hypothetical protein